MSSAAPLTVRQLLDWLAERGLFDAGKHERAAEVLAHPRQALNVGIKLLTVIGAWIAAGAFLGFVMALVRPDHGTTIMMGLGYCVGATLLRRIARHDFFIQVALALLLAGYGMVLSGVGYSPSSPEAPWCVASAAVALAAALYFVYDYPVQRFLVPLIAAQVVFWELLGAGRDEPSYSHVALYALVLLETLAVLALLAGPPKWTSVRPLGLAMAAALMISVGHISLPHEFRREFTSSYSTLALWPFNVILAAGLLWLVRFAARQAGPAEAGVAQVTNLRYQRGPVLVALGTIVLLAVVANPGILAGLLLLVLGHAVRDIYPFAFGIVLLVGSLALFWCNLDMQLTARAGLLVASGLVLLGARFGLWRLEAHAAWARKEAP